MNRKISVIVALVLLGNCHSKKESNKTLTTDNTETRNELSTYIENLIDEYRIGGAIAIGIVKDGQVITEEVYGYADYEAQKKASLDTRFYIASMTKSFVGTLVKMMEGRNQLDLEAPVNDILKMDFPAEVQADEITIEDLLIHTTGLKNSTVAIKTAYTGNFTNDELVEDFTNYTYQESYGTYSYTNIGYILAGMALEQLTQKSWKQLLEEEVFQPLNMEHTSAYLNPNESPEISAQLALPHTLTEDSIKTGRFMKRDDTMHAAGGLTTTVGDMNQWLLAHLDTTANAYFSKEILDEIHTDRIDFYDTNAGVNNYGYGLGWEQGDWYEYDISWHGGGYPGYVSVHALVREENLGVVIMMSQQSRVIGLILNYILAEQLGVDNEDELANMEETLRFKDERQQHYKDSVFQLVGKANLKNIELEKYAGQYSDVQHSQVVIQVEEDKLVLQAGNLLFFGEYLGDDKFLIKSEVDDSFGTIDFYHLNSSDRKAYLDMFGQKYYKG